MANKKRGQREKEREEREKGEKEKREREREKGEKEKGEKEKRERERDFITVILKTVFSVPDISVRMQVCVQFCYFC